MNVNYISVFYMGARRSAGPACHVQEHLDFLQEHQTPLDRVTLVLNADSKEQIVEFGSLVRQYKPFYTKLKVLIRQNSDYSYGGWQDAIHSSIKNGDESDYFLLEDDYIPNIKGFLDPFYSRMDSKTAYVCEKVLPLPGQHAAHSVGLLNGTVARLVTERHGSPLLIAPAINYSGGEWNQVHFLDNMTQRGYKLKDISDEYSVPFSDPSGIFRELGVPNAIAPIVPVGYNG